MPQNVPTSCSVYLPQTAGSGRVIDEPVRAERALPRSGTSGIAETANEYVKWHVKREHHRS